MAITASIALSSATAKTGQKIAATITITNSGTTAVLVTNVAPSAVPHSGTSGSVSVSLGVPPIGPGENITVPGSSGTLNMEFDVVPMGPQVPTYATDPFASPGQGGATIVNLPPLAMPQSLAYDIGALIYTNDGSVTAATVATLTVTPTSY